MSLIRPRAAIILRRYIKELMKEAGLSIREDPMGNIFGRWVGEDPNAGGTLSASILCSPFQCHVLLAPALHARLQLQMISYY
jgi:acetylornithine deacetylase/succinyl-diaminopimelate desuccinylase-like protein